MSTTTNTPATTDTTAVDNKELKTITELKKIPVVVSALETVPQYYSAFKKTNVVVDTGCFFAEKYVQISLAILTPLFFFCFQKPVYAVDEFARKYLVKLHETFPVVMTPTDQVYAKCDDLYTMTVRTPLKLTNEYVRYGAEKAVVAKNFAESAYVKYAKKYVDQLYAMACERFVASAKSKVY